MTRAIRLSSFGVLLGVLFALFAALPVFAQTAPTDTSEAVKLFASLSPQQALGYLQQMPADQRQGFLAQLGKEACICVLNKMGEEGIKMLVSQLPPEDSQAFFDNLNPKTYMQFVGSVKDPELLNSLGFDDAATRDQYVLENLSSLDKESASVVLQQLLLTTEDPTIQQAILDLTGNDSETASFLALSPAERAQLLSESSPEQLQALGAKLSEMTDFFQGVDPSAIADALDMVNAEDASYYLSAIDTDEIAAVLAEMDSLSQLQALVDAYQSDLADIGITSDDLAALSDALQTQQEELAALYDLDYTDIDEAGAQFIEEMTDEANAEATEVSGDEGSDSSTDATEVSGDSSTGSDESNSESSGDKSSESGSNGGETGGESGSNGEG